MEEAFWVLIDIEDALLVLQNTNSIRPAYEHSISITGHCVLKTVGTYCADCVTTTASTKYHSDYVLISYFVQYPAGGVVATVLEKFRA